VNVGEFFDAAVEGADPVQKRTGFCALLVRTEAMASVPLSWRLPTAFARDLIVQETRVATRAAVVVRASWSASCGDVAPTLYLLRPRMRFGSLVAANVCDAICHSDPAARCALSSDVPGSIASSPISRCWRATASE
jgi:hypothetical protein